MKTVQDLLNALKNLPPDAQIADNHLGDIYVEDKVTKWRKIFSFIAISTRIPAVPTPPCRG